MHQARNGADQTDERCDAGDDFEDDQSAPFTGYLLVGENGRIVLDGTDLAGAETDAVVRAGVIQVPQGRMLFGAMTVRENLDLGGQRLVARPLLAAHALGEDLEPTLRKLLQLA